MDAHLPCPDAALLAAFLDGTLADYERTAVVTHLAECPLCRAVALTVVEYQEVQALDTLWQSGTMPAPPPPLTATGTERWSREKTRAPALVMVVAALAATAALAIPVSSLLPSWSAQRAMTSLVDAAGGYRPLEARLSGAHRYAPPPAIETAGSAPRHSLQLITAATDVRTAFADDEAVLSRRAVGMAALLVGDLDNAISTLEIAVAADRRDPRLNNDLAAAYYERSQREARPDDLPAALSAVERVIAGHPGHLEGLFNRALIITALGLRAEAEAAWQDYIARDPDSPWSSEARGRLAASGAQRPRLEWTALLARFESTGSVTDAEAAVRDHASAARDYIENGLLKRWVDAATQRDRAGADRILEQVQVLGEAFARLGADRLYGDFVKAVRAGRVAGTEARVVAAHEEYLAGMALMTAQRFSDAAPILRRATRRLSAIGSPFSLRAEIEVAATAYFDLRYTDAISALAPVKSTARQRGHTILVTRAAWLEGMTAFSRNEFAAARIRYEEMLASATAGGDNDQWVMAKVLLANLHDVLGQSPLAWQHRVDAAARLDGVFSSGTRSAYLASASGDAAAGGHDAAALLFHSLIGSGPEISANLEVQVRSQRARSLYRLDRRVEARAELAIARARLTAVTNTANQLRIEADLLAAEADVWQDDDRPRAVRAAERLLTLPLVQHDHLRRARAHLQLADAALQDGDLDRGERAVNEGFAALEAFAAAPSAEFAIRSSDSVWRLYGNAVKIALRRGDLARAFEYSERARIRTPQERRAWQAHLASLDEVQRALERDTVLTLLTQIDEQLQIWVIRRDDVAAHTLPISSARAAALVATQFQEITGGAPAPRASAELFDSLFRPVSRLLVGASKLVVVADAPYNQIAYAGLWDRRTGRYVIEDRGVVLAPSATAFTWAMQRSRHGSGPPQLRWAAMMGGAHDQPLHATLADSLGSLYGSRLTRNQGATASHLIEEVAGRDVVHVTARVVGNAQFPGLSYLQMADDSGQKYSGPVFARNVADARPRAQLVALQSQVAADVATRGDAFGFARALLAAGIPNVVSSTVDIEDQSVERTWLEFHRQYAQGTAAVESLRRAQLAALSASDRRPGPWATLTVFGSTQ